MKEESVLIQGPAGQLEALCSVSNALVPEIGIVCHPHPLFSGNMHHKVVTTVVKALSDAGLNTLRFNFRGVGNSEGQFGHGVGEQEDLKTVLEWAQKEGFKIHVLGGFSFGAYISVQVASSDFMRAFNLKRLISIALPLQYFGGDSMSPINCSWLLVHGTSDQITPIGPLMAWSQNTQQKHQLVCFEGVEHFFHGQLIRLRQLLQDFLAS